MPSGARYHTTRAPALRYRIVIVIGCRAQEQVATPNARWVVASMEDEHTRWHIAPGHTMRTEHLTSALEHPVAILVMRGYP